MILPPTGIAALDSLGKDQLAHAFQQLLRTVERNVGEGKLGTEDLLPSGERSSFEEDADATVIESYKQIITNVLASSDRVATEQTRDHTRQ